MSQDTHKWIIEVTVDDRGRVETTLLIDGCPVEGHGDTTGTLTIQQLMGPLVRRVAVNAEDTRRRRT